MGFKKPTEVSESYLKNANLPHHGQSYTVVPHGDVINLTKKSLRKNNFQIIRETYKANKSANVAQGVLYLKNKNDFSDTGMMFGWTNSYDKSVRFQCAVGAYVMVCSNLMVAGDISYGRKHTGTAYVDIIQQVNNQISQADNIFTNINNDKFNMMQKQLTFQEQCALAGLLYIEEEIINNQQLNIIKQEMKKPSFDYDADHESAWSFYNHVTHSLKSSHPKNWMKKSKEFHRFMTTKVLGKSPVTSSDNLQIDDMEELELYD
jgi:hypothetical protein